MKKNSTLKNLFFWLLLIITAVFIYRYLNNEKSVNSENLPASAIFNYLPENSTGEIIQHTAFTLSYKEEFEQAEWVAYELTKNEVNDVTGREDRFTEDPKISTGSAEHSDYSRSGFDRGHLAPSADMRFNSTAQKECFYMSNIAPQTPELNRGVWKSLEEQTRNNAGKYGNIYIITGGILRSGLPTIGKTNKIAVPEYFYKIIYIPSASECIGFLIPNFDPAHTFDRYRVTVDSIEKLTGLNFFPALPDDLENSLEAKVSSIPW